MPAMKLISVTCHSSDDGEKIVRANVCVADHADLGQRKEWIEFQLEVDLPTIRNGAFLRKEVLEKAHGILDQLAKKFQSLANQSLNS